MTSEYYKHCSVCKVLLINDKKLSPDDKQESTCIACSDFIHFAEKDIYLATVILLDIYRKLDLKGNKNDK